LEEEPQAASHCSCHCIDAPRVDRLLLVPVDRPERTGTPVQAGILNLAVLFLIVFLALTFAIVYVEKGYDYFMPKILERIFDDKEW